MTSRIGMEINGFKILSSKCVTTEKSKNTIYTVECLKCGSISDKRSGDVMSGRAKCYCSAKCKLHGKAKTRLYSIYRGMKERTQNPKNKAYYRYGARGIKVCDEWLNDFNAFYDWAMSSGYSEDLTIDRIDVDDDYCPQNCRWSTRSEQSNNTSQCVHLEYQGLSLTPRQWSEKLGISIHTIRWRMLHKFPVEQILSTERIKTGRKHK